jgi:hypothetical protein
MMVLLGRFERVLISSLYSVSLIQRSTATGLKVSYVNLLHGARFLHSINSDVLQPLLCSHFCLRALSVYDHQPNKKKMKICIFKSHGKV